MGTKGLPPTPHGMTRMMFFILFGIFLCGAIAACSSQPGPEPWPPEPEPVPPKPPLEVTWPARELLLQRLRSMYIKFNDFFVVCASLSPPVFDVNSLSDDGDANPGDGVCQNASGDCTLRASIQESNAMAGFNTIKVPAGTVSLLGTGLTITDRVSISGPLIIDGAALHDSIFKINTSNSCGVQLSGLTIQNGGLTQYGGGVFISTDNVVKLIQVKISGNKVMSLGGGIVNYGRLTIESSMITGNDVAARGGGISNLGTLHLSSNTISDNEANVGGGIQNQVK